MASLGAALGGEGTVDRLPGRSLPTLVLGRLGYPAGAGAPRIVCADWRGEADRLYGRELEIQVALRDPHNELLTHYLNSAVAAGDIDEARRLIGAGASPNVEVCRIDEAVEHSTMLPEEPSLMIATWRRSSLEILELLLEAGADPNVVYRDWIDGKECDMTPLCAVVHHGRLLSIHGPRPLEEVRPLERLVRLLEHGADPNFVASHAPLYLAVAFSHVSNTQSEMKDIVRVLLDHGADINIKDRGCQGSTPLIAAVCDPWGCTLLPDSSSSGGLSMLRLLIERGAAVNAADDCGGSPLFYASRDGCIPAVKCLLRHGAAYDQPNNEGVTPLAAARALLRTNVPSGIDGDASGLDQLRNLYRQIDIARNGGNAPALNALWDEYLWQLLRAWISVRGPQVGTSARYAVASTPELSRQVVAFLVGDTSIHA